MNYDPAAVAAKFNDQYAVDMACIPVISEFCSFTLMRMVSWMAEEHADEAEAIRSTIARIGKMCVMVVHWGDDARDQWVSFFVANVLTGKVSAIMSSEEAASEMGLDVNMVKDVRAGAIKAFIDNLNDIPVRKDGERPILYAGVIID